jgi:hypothetical protein
MVMNRRNFFGLTAALAAPAAAPSSKATLRPAICAYSFRKELAARTMSYEDLVRLAASLDVGGLDLTVYWFPSTGTASCCRSSGCRTSRRSRSTASPYAR